MVYGTIVAPTGRRGGFPVTWRWQVFDLWNRVDQLSRENGLYFRKVVCPSIAVHGAEQESVFPVDGMDEALRRRGDEVRAQMQQAQYQFLLTELMTCASAFDSAARNGNSASATWPKRNYSPSKMAMPPSAAFCRNWTAPNAAMR